MLEKQRRTMKSQEVWWQSKEAGSTFWCIRTQKFLPLRETCRASQVFERSQTVLALDHVVYVLYLYFLTYNCLWKVSCSYGRANEHTVRGKISLSCGSRCCPNIFYFLCCPTSVSVLWRKCTYIQIYDCVQIVYELSLLPHNIACETFLHELGAVRSPNWIFIIGVPAWPWLGEYVTWGKAFYSLLFEQEVTEAPVIATFSALSHFSRQPILRHITITLWIWL